MSNKNSLWPENLTMPTIESTPVKILRDQALALGEITNNVLEAEVLTRLLDRDLVSFAVAASRFLNHSFYVKAPALDDYRYELFRVRQETADLYPLTIITNSTKADHADTAVTAENEAEFRQRIKEILASEETKRVINSLWQQSVVTQGVNYDAL